MGSGVELNLILGHKWKSCLKRDMSGKINIEPESGAWLRNCFARSPTKNIVSRNRSKHSEDRPQIGEEGKEFLRE
ncbi:hypothetical protein ACH5RR_012890 [Cinchona calisaya]|uniref:Ycf15 n=1 Tax=Cinchona calisaya TaxID=153742 RepID=A0ABD3A949_9GENT